MTAPISGLPEPKSIIGPDRAGIPLGDPPSGPSFKDTLASALGDVSRGEEHAQGMIEAFVRGEDVEIYDVMAASEEANLSLELLVQVRNKLTEAYRTIMNLQT